jgi:hypothetical protein
VAIRDIRKSLLGGNENLVASSSSKMLASRECLQNLLLELDKYLLHGGARKDRDRPSSSITLSTYAG